MLFIKTGKQIFESKTIPELSFQSLMFVVLINQLTLVPALLKNLEKVLSAMRLLIYITYDVSCYLLHQCSVPA